MSCDIAGHLIDSLFCCLDPADDLLALVALKGKDLVELCLELGHKPPLIIGGPSLSGIATGSIEGRRTILRKRLEASLQSIVVDVMGVVILDEGRLKLSAKPIASHDIRQLNDFTYVARRGISSPIDQ